MAKQGNVSTVVRMRRKLLIIEKSGNEHDLLRSRNDSKSKLRPASIFFVLTDYTMPSKSLEYLVRSETQV